MFCVLVVSSIDLETDTPTVKPSTFLNSSIKDDVINVNNDYRYMKTGYYVSLHAEILGDRVIPSTKDCVDAYRVPILLLRAAKRGVPTIPFLITDSPKRIIQEFGLPVIVFPLSPFTFNRLTVIKSRSTLYKSIKKLSFNHRYTVCAQPLYGELISCKSFFGYCHRKDLDVKDTARKVYQIFRIPLCKLLIQKSRDSIYLCGLQPLNMDEITVSDFVKISRILSRREGLFD